MEEKKELGKRGELAAKKFLLKNNYNIIATNYKISHKEIDIICFKNGEYFFIEVKTRLKSRDSINENPLLLAQTKNIKRAILYYAELNFISLDLIHLDLIFILADKKTNTAELRHYRDIF